MALVEGVKYGLSSQGNSSAKKLVIFVKLTDSALRAIEDCLQLQQKTGQHATLQFLGNEGRIHIPSSHTNDGHSFDFSLLSNADIEGPQGSFECIKQNGSRSLESMGTLPFKMRIHAKDDVYDLTRQKINYVEDKRKQDCAKEIKQPGAESGRKVKKKIIGGVAHPPLPQRREPSPISNFTNSKTSLLSSNTNSKFSNGYSNSGSQYYNNGGNHPTNYKNSGLNPHSHGPMSKVPARGGASVDIQRKTLRERLIHMLALKPLKKPEILTKLTRDGMKEKDKKLLMMTLQSVSQLKDNVYNLSRGMWNDVHEDWPYYTEEERQIMKRRKPQNLTPPGSDCSVGSGTSGSSSSPRSTTSGSGHSPTSYTSGSSSYSSNNNHQSPYGPAMKSYNYPSHSTNSGNGSLPGQLMQQSQGVKRPNGFDASSGGGPGGGFDPGNGQNNNDIPNKKLRVSHFKRPTCSNGSSSNSANNNVRIESRDSPNSNKDSSSHQQLLPSQQQSSPYHQQQRSGNSQSSSGPGSGYNQERWSPTMTGLAPHNNHRSPKNIKDHHSPPYNSSNSNNQNSTVYHHQPSNHVSQGKDYGDEAYSSSSTAKISNTSWTGERRNGHHGTQPIHPSNQPPPHQSTVQDNGYGLDSKLPDLDDNDSVDSGNGSSSSSCSGIVAPLQSSSINASVNNHINHHGGSKSTVYSSTSSASSYGITNSELVVNSSSNSNNLSGVNSNNSNNNNVPKRERERDYEGIASNNSGCNRVTSTTNSGTTKGFHSPQPSPDSQIETISLQQQQQQLPPPPSIQQHQPKKSRLEEHPKELVVDEKHRDISSVEVRGKSEHGKVSSRDRVKERSRGDRDRVKDRNTERDSVRPKSEIPSHALAYTSIRTLEQRNQYKADFSTEYDEYRNLHSVIDKVSKKFAQLQERLRKEEKGSEGYQVVRDQIIKEYTKNKNNQKYVDARARFAYLHEKLSHIKRLVMDYDTLHSADGSGSGRPGDDEDF